MTDIYTEIRQTLGDIIFCLACQRPLNKTDTLRLIAHMRNEKSLNADETLDPVTLSLLVAMWYCFDVSVLQREDNEGTKLIKLIFWENLFFFYCMFEFVCVYLHVKSAFDLKHTLSIIMTLFL